LLLLLLLPLAASPARTSGRALATSTNPIHGGTDVKVSHAINNCRPGTLSRS